MCSLGKVLGLLERCRCPDFRRQHSGSSTGGSCFGILVYAAWWSCIAIARTSCQGMFSLARPATRRGPHETSRDAKTLTFSWSTSCDELQLSACSHLVFSAFVLSRRTLTGIPWGSRSIATSRCSEIRTEDRQNSSSASPVLVEQLLLLSSFPPRPSRTLHTLTRAHSATYRTRLRNAGEARGLAARDAGLQASGAVETSEARVDGARIRHMHVAFTPGWHRLREVASTLGHAWATREALAPKRPHVNTTDDMDGGAPHVSILGPHSSPSAACMSQTHDTPALHTWRISEHASHTSSNSEQGETPDDHLHRSCMFTLP